MERFSCLTRIISAPGAAECVKELAPKRIFLVTDPYFHENGTAARLLHTWQAESACFHGVQPDPTAALAAEVTAQLKAFQPDTVVALGGGSALDLAKATVYFSGLSPRLVAIPTTSGSGSEVTDFAILTHEGVKHPLVDEKLRPTLALLDSTLLGSLPPKLIADTGFDVLTHALEAYTAQNAGTFARTLARDAFVTTFALLPASVGGEKGVRGRIHEASCMAGLAFSHSGLGLCHAMAHALGGAFHLPHGRLNAILLPAVMDCNGYCAAEGYAALAQAAGVGGSAVSVGMRNLKNALVRLRKELDLPATLAEAGIAPHRVWERAEELVKATLADPCCRTNPQSVEAFLVRKVLEAVTGRA